MSLKNTKTTTSGIEWNSMLGLVYRLKQDKRYRDYLLILTGCYFGLRAKDLLSIKWVDVLDKDDLLLTESKTKKERTITINPSVKEALRIVSNELIRSGRFEIDGYVFANRWGDRLSLNYVNKQLRRMFIAYNVKIQNPSSHSLRKTFGRRVWEMDGKSERSLVYLSEIFSHSSTAITRRYIGITQQQIADVYMRL